MQITDLLLFTLLALYRPPALHAQCLERHHDAIVQQATESAERYGVPVSILLVTAFLETHLGCDPAEAGGWGAPTSRSRRHVAGNSDNAASALAHSFAACGTWLGAVNRFRCGSCRCPHLIGYQPPYALHLVERVHHHAHVPLPPRFR